MVNIKRGDWVHLAGNPSVGGTIRRVGADGSWADVVFPNGVSKRMKTPNLVVDTAITVGDITITDLTRLEELTNG